MSIFRTGPARLDVPTDEIDLPNDEGLALRESGTRPCPRRSDLPPAAETAARRADPPEPRCPSARNAAALLPAPSSGVKALRLGSCELYYELATGGMATVWIGVHHGSQGFEKIVAVKRLLPIWSCDPFYIAMLADEAFVSSRVNHPWVRDIFDVGTAEDGSLYLVMEFLSGEPLSRVFCAMANQSVLLRTTSHVRIVSRIIANCCEAAHAVHELSDHEAPLDVVHRDLTPHNLFVLHDGTVRVTDFGIMRARVRRQRPSGKTELKGKPAYMSPEYVACRPYDRRSDVWTLGVVLWEILTGMRLFRRQSLAETCAAVLHDPIPMASTYCSHVDRELDGIVAKAVCRCVDDRYPTTDEMAKTLEAYLARRGDSVTPVDVGDWLRQRMPNSLPTLTALVKATRDLTASSRPTARPPSVRGASPE